MSTTLESKRHDTSYYIKTIIGLAIMVFFGMLPAPAPITQAGMILLGQFIGLVFLWTFVDMTWPTFTAILMFGFIAVDIYPNSFAMASIYEAGQQSLGNWVVVIIICLLLIGDVLDDCGLIRRIALWFITRKIAKSSPWGFTFMIMLATLVLGLFMDNSAVQVLMFALAGELFAIIGTKPEEKWGKVVAIGITFTTVMSCGITPICHTMPILFMGIYSAIAGTSVNWISYMAITIPAALIMWVAMLLFFRFVVKPDMSKLKNMDYAKVEALRPGPMSSKEKFVAVTFVILVICWIVPGLLDVLAPTWGVTLWLDNNTTMLSPMLIIITLYAIVRFDATPGYHSVWEALKAGVKKLYDAGVPFAVGCDSMIPFVPAGESMHDELSCLVETGIDPMSVIKMATMGNATLFGMDKTIGSIEPGKAADMIVLGSNPLDDISNTKDIKLVTMDGRVIVDRMLAV